MSKIRNFNITLGLVLVTTAMLAAPAMAQTEMQVNYTWTAPTTGSAVDHYVVQHRVNGTTWVEVATVSTNSYTLAASIGDSHEIRVAGVDAQSRQGVWSTRSDAYTPDLGAPGQPGKPTIF